MVYFASASRLAIIENGEVVNVIRVGPGFQPPHGVVAIETDTANIGDFHDGESFITRPVKFSKADLISYAHIRLDNVLNIGISVDFDEAVINIPADSATCAKVHALAWVAEAHDKSATLVIRDTILRVSPEEISHIYESLMMHIARCYDVFGAVLKAIEDGGITSIEGVNSPETVNLDPWYAPNA